MFFANRNVELTAGEHPSEPLFHSIKPVFSFIVKKKKVSLIIRSNNSYEHPDFVWLATLQIAVSSQLTFSGLILS